MATLPYTPLRWKLYDPHELFAGFDPADPRSFAATADFAIYQHFVVEGRHAPQNPFVSMMQALHDNSITQAVRGVVTGRRVAAVMGGHKMLRGSEPYRNVALLTRRLARQGFLICTGGGPGAMEAGHLGAALAPASDDRLEAAIATLSVSPAVPGLAGMIAPDGRVDARLVAAAQAWFAPAFDVARSLDVPGESLATPTWHYGHEPSTPLATHIGKYFQNSIREDGLLALAQGGIVFAEGRAGTIQEIFQDAAQNYYRSFEYFSPMVLLGTRYWQETFPVEPLLQRLFAPEDFTRFVLVTDDVDAAAAFIETFVPAY